MSVLFVNACNYGSTGKIINNLCHILKSKNIECLFALPKTKRNKENLKDNQVLFGGKISRNFSFFLSKTFGNTDNFNLFNTFCLIRIIKKFKPDIIHLHNLHGNYLNIHYFFGFLKKCKIKVVWTLHDCWSFTGRCPHFAILDCGKWETGCYSCPYSKEDYPISKIDKTKIMWKLKKSWFTGIKELTIVTPSHWLAGLVRRSYLKNYPIKVIKNGVDLSIFNPTINNFKKRHSILYNNYIILGVAFGWGISKGLDVFIALSKTLPNNFQIVLVGTDDDVDKSLPKRIVSIHRTNSQQELADIYTSADLFVNPTREDTLPTVNMESLACGTPVLTFRTGGSPEIIDETCGSVVDVDDIDSLEKEIIRICETKPYSKEACLERAKLFDMNDRFKEYIDLYKELSGNQ